MLYLTLLKIEQKTFSLLNATMEDLNSNTLICIAHNNAFKAENHFPIVNKLNKILT